MSDDGDAPHASIQPPMAAHVPKHTSLLAWRTFDIQRVLAQAVTSLELLLDHFEALIKLLANVQQVNGPVTPLSDRGWCERHGDGHALCDSDPFRQTTLHTRSTWVCCCCKCQCCKCRLMISQILKMCLGCHPIIGARLPRVCDPRLPKSAIGWGLEAIQPKHVRESQAHLYVIPPIVLGGKIACWWSGRCVAGAVCLSVVACCPTGTYVCPPCTALPAVHRLSIVPRVLLGGIARWIGTVAG